MAKRTLLLCHFCLMRKKEKRASDGAWASMLRVTWSHLRMWQFTLNYSKTKTGQTLNVHHSIAKHPPKNRTSEFGSDPYPLPFGCGKSRDLFCFCVSSMSVSSGRCSPLERLMIMLREADFALLGYWNKRYKTPLTNMVYNGGVCFHERL